MRLQKCFSIGLLCLCLLALCACGQPAQDTPESELQSLREQVDALQNEMERRVGHLENYFDRSSPEKVAALWCEAVMKRNGALEYALYSDALKAETYDVFVELDWHTGVSSPHAVEFAVENAQPTGDAVIVPVALRMVASGGVDGIEPYILTLRQTQLNVNEDWYITAVAME